MVKIIALRRCVIGTFSTKMRTVALNLITKLGNPCTLEKVTRGGYNPSLGKTEKAIQPFNTFSAPAKSISVFFDRDGPNTNLAGFDEGKVSIPYLGINQIMDETWTYNGEAIKTVEPIEAQGEIIIFIITVASS